MARPCKSAKVLTDKSQTIAEINARIEGENSLKGSGKLPVAPEWFSEKQKDTFDLIVSELKTSDILCRLDTWILQECVLAIDNLEYIGRACNNTEEKDIIFDRNILAAKEKYTKILFRCCNELSLSPQSRAKIANINSQAADDGTELLKQLLAGENADEEE